MEEIYSQVTARLLTLLEPFVRSITNPAVVERLQQPGACDFIAGNPQEMPLPGFVEALQRWSVPQSKDWFAYKLNVPEARAAAAASLRQRRGIPFREEDIYLTTGAFGALSVALGVVVDPGDEVIYVSPPWFFYEALIVRSGGTPVRVRVDERTYDLDLQAIAAAVTPRTRAIIINSPHNPTGKIYSPETLRGLAEILDSAGRRNGRPVYLLSDEAYCRIVYDGRPYPSPTAFYPNSFLIYTYGKTLLTPGERLGYIALPPTMEQREGLSAAIFIQEAIGGHMFPNAVLQYALADLERLSIDVGHLQRKRDRMVSALSEMGYQVHVPEGTFYLLPRSPISDDIAFVNRLAERDIFCLPGRAMEMPGYFRISLTANDDMIERALPGFEAVLEETRQRV
jgi:aspartate aminotransferase